MVMEKLTGDVKQESLRTMMLADDIMIFIESREKVEQSLKRWRNGLEKRGIRV